MFQALRFFLVLVGCSLVGLAWGHHSNAPHFDTEVEVKKTGVVTQWKFVNPHAYLHFNVMEDGKTVQWRCETDAATGLKRRGYTSDSFRVGEELTVIGNPAKREDNSCFFRDVILADGTQINRNTNMSEVRAAASLEPVLPLNTEDRVLMLANGEPNISGFWWDGDDSAPSGPPPAANPAGGMMGMGMGMAGQSSRLEMLSNMPLTAAGEKLRDSYEFIYDDPALQCKMANIMDGLGRDEAVSEIRQNANSITIMYGYMDYLRTIHMDTKAHPDNLEPSLGGHSVGSWDGDKLIVDTVGFLPSVLHPRTGIPTSEQLHVVEEFRYDAVRKELLRSYVAKDPVYFAEEFSGEDRLRAAPRAYEPYDCEPLSGVNNLRPGTPEYEAELIRMKAAKDNVASAPALAQSAGEVALDEAPGGSGTKIIGAIFLGLIFFVGGFLLQRGKSNK